mmetsp:Transcript_6243/g.23487  ORF Transcript_6243/g.23487 Transcript_6243/m.23487 type:complete len:170 (-) Transcript_6243:184-693(-)
MLLNFHTAQLHTVNKYLEINDKLITRLHSGIPINSLLLEEQDCESRYVVTILTRDTAISQNAKNANNVALDGGRLVSVLDRQTGTTLYKRMTKAVHGEWISIHGANSTNDKAYYSSNGKKSEKPEKPAPKESTVNASTESEEPRYTLSEVIEMLRKLQLEEKQKKDRKQ